MNFKKIIILGCVLGFLTGCGEDDIKTTTKSDNSYSELMNYNEALELFYEGEEAVILDIESGISFKVRRIEGGFDTLADVETLSLEETEKMLEAVGGWSIIRRAVIVTIGDTKIAASIAPFAHSGDENFPYGEIIDNRSGSTGTGINLDSIRDNGMIGVVDIYFYNSLIPGINMIDERHQEMVLEASTYEG